MTAITQKIKRVLTVQECNVCIASKAEGNMIDLIHPDTGLTVCFSKTLEQVQKEYPDAEVMTVDAFCQWKAEQQHAPIAWNATTEEEYNNMLNCLPPALWLGRAFLMGEPWDHDASNGQPRFAAYRVLNDGTCQVASRPMTRTEFRTAIRA